MEQRTEEIELLELLPRPVFCAKEGLITRLNQPARKLYLREGLRVDALMEAGNENYAAFSGGLLYVTLTIHGQSFGASVVRMGDEDLFTLDQQFESEQLRVLALAARELRAPLTDAMLAAEQLSQDDVVRGKLNRSLYQLLRVIGNMSDASGSSLSFHPERRNVNAVFREIAEKITALSGTSGTEIIYTGLQTECSCVFDRQLMERAVLNMVSNALKFTPAGGTIHLLLRASGKQFCFSVTDTGSGIPEKEQATLFSRYLREPCLEDSRHGIGLGMLLIRNTAALHKGAVLIDHPAGSGARVTITFRSVGDDTALLHNALLAADYAGEQDHALIELSEFLPYDKYF